MITVPTDCRIGEADCSREAQEAEGRTLDTTTHSITLIFILTILTPSVVRCLVKIINISLKTPIIVLMSF